MEDIKAYRPTSNSVGSGQVLQCAYSAETAKLVVREMADSLVYDLVDNRLVTDQLTLTVGYDIENLTDPNRQTDYHGEIKTDYYGRKVPKHAHGSISLEKYTSSTKEILQAVSTLYDRIINPKLLVRRLNLTANHVISETEVPVKFEIQQLDLFTDHTDDPLLQADDTEAAERERQMQETLLHIKRKYGKNAIYKGMNTEDGATALERNQQIGGHKA